VILVTGCGSGIGLALAELLYKEPGYRAVITARSHSMEFLREHFQENENFLIRPLDVTDASQRQKLLEEINVLWGGVQVLINNAGLCYRAVLEHMSAEDEFLQMKINYLGPIELIKAVLPKMREEGRGKIINISSVSGMLAMPTMASYSASKHALEGASEALWYEMRPFGINVSLIQPGFVRSSSFLKVRLSETSQQAAQVEGPYLEYYKNMTPFIARLMGVSLTRPEDVARKVLKVVRRRNPPLWIPVTLDAQFFYYLRRFFPRKLLLPLLFSRLPKVRLWARGYRRQK